MGSELAITRPEATAPVASSGVSSPKTRELGQLFLQRFHRLLAMRASPRLIPTERRLIDHALYSIYWDAVDLGLRADVTAALHASAGEERPDTAGRP